MRGVYLIHFNTKLEHAQHYIGYSNDIFTRYMQHGTRQGANILYVARQRGITWRLVRTWPRATRTIERKLKNRHNHKHLCPICTPRIQTDPNTGASPME